MQRAQIVLTQSRSSSGCYVRKTPDLVHQCQLPGSPAAQTSIGSAANRAGARWHGKFQDIWKEQCVATRSIRARHGILFALDYLIGEKLLTYAEVAVTRPEFARELPRFVAEVRNVFNGEEIRHYLDHLERMAAMEDERPPDEDDDDFFVTSLTKLPQTGRVSLS